MGWKKVEYSPELLAQTLGAKLVGPTAGVVIRQLAPLDASAPDALSFAKRLPKLPTMCGALLCDEGVAAKLALTIPCIIVSDPIRALVQISPLFYEPDSYPAGVHPSAVIDPSATVAASAHIGPFVSIGAGAVIEEGCVIHSHVSIYPRVTIRRRAVVHAHAVIREDCEVGEAGVIQPGAVIGADGFGYLPDPKRGLVPVPQMGSVTLHRGVDVGANSCIDRATIGETRIGVGTKVDNLVQIGHNVTIGSHSIICGQSGIAGSCSLGDQVVMGGNAGVADHVSITSNVRVAAKSAVMHDISAPGDYGGYPAAPAREWRKSIVVLRRLSRQDQARQDQARQGPDSAGLPKSEAKSKPEG
jgi:UDP-3-O-[3-hydroxymyristoyl] glucosamine N-acyltransferase